MAKTNSFDVSTSVDLQEVDNAINQVKKEVATRYDFRGTDASVDFDRGAGSILLEADDDYKLTALMQMLREKFVRRGVPVKNIDEGSAEEASLGRRRQRVGLKQSIDTDTAKKIVKAIKDQKFKKVQASIQGDEVRVSAPKRDDLQAVIAFLKTQDFGLELSFGNYR
jgi:uncharacterized protein YajQ (UPF0234 family)